MATEVTMTTPKGGKESPEFIETTLASDIARVPTTAEGTVVTKGRWERTWPVLAAGAGLFSDGYLNSVIGSVSTMLAIIYPDEYAHSSAQQNVSSITFAGTVLGQLIFGFGSDYYSRKKALLVSTGILIVMAILCTGAYGYRGSISGLFVALTVYRFLLGIGIGGEYPAGSVAAAEATGELKHGHRHRWFVMFTNVQIDLGFVIGAFVPLVCVWICGESHLRLAWRLALGFGIFPPLSLFYLRTKLQEPAEYQQQTMKNTKVPWLLVFKFYWKRWLVVATLWFIYDFSAYAFGIYSSTILTVVLGDSAPLWKSFGWNTVINLFYMPGAILGACKSPFRGLGSRLRRLFAEYVADEMSNSPLRLSRSSTSSCSWSGRSGYHWVYHGGLLRAARTASAHRRLAGAMGKTGAFVGSYVFPIMERDAPGGASGTHAAQYPFWVASSLCLFSCALVWFTLPEIGQDTIADEDMAFRAYLEENGWDTRQMGMDNASVETQFVETVLEEERKSV